MKKKWIAGLTSIVAVSLLLVGCGKSSSTKETTITVGASNIPHSEILKHVQPELKKEGVNLKIKVFQDYVLPNKDLANKDLDANYFQHIPFLKNWNKQNNGTLVSAGNVHLEPIGAYSKKYKSLKAIPSGSTILVSNNVADYGRVLTILRDAGLVTLKSGTDITTATFKDIKDNKKNLKFKTDLEPKLMPQFYNNKEGAAVFINANYAVQAGLDPTKDSIALEKNSSPYVNIVAVRKGDTKKPAIKKLMKALQSKDTQQWITKKYKGAVVPAYPNGK
ncbi:MetQ/NlpA family ABC transporter substrate-binding protein [Secundilactobacillus malefermentans]|uniref:MetQ/NlpA family ABC transporter substrate-binding protein n=1 Tax=Secundilactobacillus malefermentans TaxID=176292 RepID=UPI0011CBA4EA|nr:MetQ/NlpA family ABC transporter substrate-binding protein [Secundilactobacillus malefermentans]QEA31885.1 MetQ/NlpA family ABC transporter substrate-binding protein [Secundilactobacillus malefermentans]